MIEQIEIEEKKKQEKKMTEKKKNHANQAGRQFVFSEANWELLGYRFLGIGDTKKYLTAI